MSGLLLGIRDHPVDVEYRAARAALAKHEPGSKERYARACVDSFALCADWAASAPDEATVRRRRVIAMRGLFRVHHPPLTWIAFAFKATADEMEEAFSGLPELTPAPAELEQHRLRRLPYEAYLRTGHWRSVRAVALRRYDSKCALCASGRDLEVHHRTYDNLGCERDADVIVLCATCHAKFHDVERAA